MKLEVFPQNFSVCKVFPGTPLPDGICFFARTDNENSLVCETEHINFQTLNREDGWRMFRVAGTMEFALIGILSRITAILADAEISIFCVSTYDTDYVLVKSAMLGKAAAVMSKNGYTISYI